MILLKWLGWLNAYRLGDGRSASTYLRPQPEFAMILQNERKRADRTQGTFSLAVFTPPKTEDSRWLDVFAERLKRRLRSTDTAGFLDEHRVAVILPGTPTAETWKIARDVTATEEDWTSPDCEVYSYPSDALIHFFEQKPQKVNEGSAQPLETLFVKRIPAWKRGIDILGAVLGLTLLSPVFVLAAIAIKLTSRGPVLFTQSREGFRGQVFKIYKFRTMCVDAEAKKAALRQFSEQDGPAFKLAADPRVTPVGKFLRKSCIDELPQLWNVLRGDMSIVGPRPLPCDESRQCSRWERQRLEVTPGLTCIWQVHGKSRVSFSEWMRMDIRYMQARSFFNDVKLVVQTMIAVLLHKASH